MNLKKRPDYSEFSNPKLVAIYNTVNGVESYMDFYLQLAKQLSANTVIDIGCGSGLISCELVKNGHKVIGVEPSKEMLELARKSDCGNQVEWKQGDALSLSDYKADLAIMTGHVAQFHLDDGYWLQALKAIYNALKQGGRFAFESRNPAVQPWNKNHMHTDWPTRDNPQSIVDPIEGEIDWWMKLLKVNKNKALYENHYLFRKSGEELVSINELVFHTYNGLVASLKKAGFVVENVYGDWDRSELRKESPEFIFVARKP